MANWAKWIAALWMMGAGTVAAAQNGPVVVELYTSQGCSSCPPADAFLHELSKRDDVIALALHVDYWDYIGWKDEFANPAYSARQRSYARVAGARSVYTPQMIIGGQDHVVGNKPRDVRALLGQHLAEAALIDLDVNTQGGKLRIEADALRPLRGAVIVQVVTFSPRERVAIKRGENAGRTLDYNNVVRSWTAVKKWNGRGSLSLTTNLPRAEGIAVILQRDNHGEILAAARVK